jgi:hypothetical protein
MAAGALGRLAERRRGTGVSPAMADITDPRVLHLKGSLFLVLGALSGGLLLLEHPRIRTLALLAVCVWAFCRFYYYAFYVIERYVDPGFRFAGLASVARYLIGRGRPRG